MPISVSSKPVLVVSTSIPQFVTKCLNNINNNARITSALAVPNKKLSPSLISTSYISVKPSSVKSIILLILFLFISTEYTLAKILPDAPDPVRGKNGMVVSASEIASNVGIQILKKGGNAIDAAVAVGFALAVTYPSAGNLGGGGFMVIHLKDGKDLTIDFREKAPLSGTKDMFLDSTGNFNPILSTEGGTSSGVPGSVAGLLYALKNYGTMSIRQVIQPAINIASKGFILDYRTAGSFSYNLSGFERYPSSLKVFTKKGTPYHEGDLFKQPNLASTLKLIRDKGLNGFYKGKVADLLIKQVKATGGNMTLQDLAAYTPVEREVVRTNYRGYEVVSMPPPSAGGITLLELLNILENDTFRKEDWGGSNYIHSLVEAMKYAYADRTKYIGDEDFVKVPKKELLRKSYAHSIYEKIQKGILPSSEVTAGNFAESSETTHYSVCDKYGNAVATTTTLNDSYGNKIVVEGAGFLLNNEMDDFSGKAGTSNLYGLIGSEVNAIQPGKRMVSSMTPTIVLKDNKPFMIVGSPGGSTIITVVLQVILNSIDFGMDIQDAINQPRIHHQWLPDIIDFEEFGLTVDVKKNLESMGYKIGTQRSLGRAEGIMIKNGIIFGATDPRGYGKAVGY